MFLEELGPLFSQGIDHFPHFAVRSEALSGET
jgi:hypothetical protein